MWVGPMGQWHSSLMSTLSLSLPHLCRWLIYLMSLFQIDHAASWNFTITRLWLKPLRGQLVDISFSYLKTSTFLVIPYQLWQLPQHEWKLYFSVNVFIALQLIGNTIITRWICCSVRPTVVNHATCQLTLINRFIKHNYSWIAMYG